MSHDCSQRGHRMNGGECESCGITEDALNAEAHTYNAADKAVDAILRGVAAMMVEFMDGRKPDEGPAEHAARLLEVGRAAWDREDL